MGVVGLVVGTGPLLAIALVATLGVARDPNPNPVGLGMIAFSTFWPSVGVILWQVRSSFFRYRADRKRFQNYLAGRAPPNSRERVYFTPA